VRAAVGVKQQGASLNSQLLVRRKSGRCADQLADQWAAAAGGRGGCTPHSEQTTIPSTMGRQHCLLLLAVLAALCGCARPSSDAPADPAPRQACSVPEMQALEALYAATGGQGWRCGAAGRPCRQVQVPAGVTGAAAVVAGQVGLAWPFGLSSSWSDARCDHLLFFLITLEPRVEWYTSL